MLNMLQMFVIFYLLIDSTFNHTEAGNDIIDILT